jgi:hypothetical protein
MEATVHICVYCSSSNQIDGVYFEAARRLGREMAARGWPLVYGGSSLGLMGALAEAIHAGGGTVIGVIPQVMIDYEIGYMQSDELIVTTTMRERKQTMEERADAFIVLPGGFGTLEEMLEIITLRQLQFHNKPILVVNGNGFFDPLLEQFARIHELGFGHKPFVEDNLDPFSNPYCVVADVEEALALLDRGKT